MSDLTELGQEAIAAVSRGVADGAPLVKCQFSRLPSMRLYGMSFARPMPPSAAACLPSRISAIGARPPTSALCRPCTNSRGPLICSSPLSRPLKRCSQCQGHGPCFA